MGLFAKSEVKLLHKKLDAEFASRLERVRSNSSYSTEQKSQVGAILLSAKAISGRFIENFTHQEKDYSKYIDSNADAFHCMFFASYIALSILKRRIENVPDLANIDFNWLTKQISHIYETEEVYLTNLLLHDEQIGDTDPRDFWSSQDMEFYRTIFKRDFDFVSTISADLAMNIYLGAESMRMRADMAHFFDEARRIKI